MAGWGTPHPGGGVSARTPASRTVRAPHVVRRPPAGSGRRERPASSPTRPASPRPASSSSSARPSPGRSRVVRVPVGPGLAACHGVLAPGPERPRASRRPASERSSPSRRSRCTSLACAGAAPARAAVALGAASLARRASRRGPSGRGRLVGDPVTTRARRPRCPRARPRGLGERRAYRRRRPRARRRARRGRRARRPARRQPARERQRDQRRGGGPQARPRAVHELAHGAVREPQVLGHLVLRAALDGDLQQRLALALGERRQSGQRLAHHRAALGQLGGPAVAVQRVVELLVVIAGRAPGVERRVVDDPVQPRPQLAHLVAAPQRAPRGDERLLQSVLGARLGQVAAAVAQQRPPVSLDDRLERPLVPGGRQRDQPLVGLGAQQLDGRGRHGNTETPRCSSCVTQRAPAAQAGSGSSSSPCSAASRTTGSFSRLRSNSAGV